MPLIKHQLYLFYPGGGFASNIQVEVRLRGGNVAVPLRADKAGTTAKANPLTTGPFGEVEFYAPSGDYVVELAGELHHVPVDPTETDDAWPDTFVHTQANPEVDWVINHWFGLRPAVTVLVNGAETEAGVSHTSDNSLTITFGAPTGGVAYLRR